MKINLMDKEKVKEKAGFLEDSLRILLELLGKAVKYFWEFLKKVIKGFIKAYT